MTSINKIEKKLEKLVKNQKRIEKTLNSLNGKVTKLHNEFEGLKIVRDLDLFLTRRGFDVFHHFPKVPHVDVVVESDGFVAVIEVCKRCDLRDLDQVVEGAEALERLEGIKPDVLIVFSYTGDVDEGVLEEAERRGIIVEWNTRRLVRKILESSKEKHK
ncbi:MAG: hypothetical protein ACP6IP_06400 [Candidatus Njordarchaeia archaeon]